MIKNRLPFIFVVTIGFVFLIPMITFAIPTSSLPLNWAQIGLGDGETFIGLGTRDPNLGNNIGLEIATGINNKYSPNLDLLYFWDFNEKITFDVGIGTYAKKAGAGSNFYVCYSGGVWITITDRITLGLGYHTLQGIMLRYGLWF